LENLQREDLNIIEEANAYQALIERGLSQEYIAQKWNQSGVENQERLNLSTFTGISGLCRQGYFGAFTGTGNEPFVDG